MESIRQWMTNYGGNVESIGTTEGNNS